VNIEKYPIDINKVPYVDSCEKKTDILSLNFVTQFGFPYNMINDKKDSRTNDVKVWLALTCATLFIFIRKMFRGLAKHVIHYYHSFFGNLFFYYGLPFLFLYSLRKLYKLCIGVFYFIVFFCAIQLTNYTIIFSPLTFPWWVYRGTEASFMKIILAIIFFWVGLFFIPVYLVWWYVLAYAGFIYVVILYLFAPFFNGFQPVIQEAGKHKLSLSLLFMALALYSAHTYLTSFLVKAGMATACVGFLCYWFYSSYYSKK
jgi:hypothetical protein